MYAIARIMHRTAMSGPAELPTGKTDRWKCKRQTTIRWRRNEALRNRSLQIARAIISAVTLPSSVTARKFPRFGFADAHLYLSNWPSGTLSLEKSTGHLLIQDHAYVNGRPIARWFVRRKICHFEMSFLSPRHSSHSHANSDPRWKLYISALVYLSS